MAFIESNMPITAASSLLPRTNIEPFSHSNLTGPQERHQNAYPRISASHPAVSNPHTSSRVWRHKRHQQHWLHSAMCFRVYQLCKDRSQSWMRRGRLSLPMPKVQEYVIDRKAMYSEIMQYYAGIGGSLSRTYELLQLVQGAYSSGMRGQCYIGW